MGEKWASVSEAGGSAEIGVDVFVAAPTAVEQENVGVVGRTEGGIREGPASVVGARYRDGSRLHSKTSRRERERERERGRERWMNGNRN